MTEGYPLPVQPRFSSLQLTNFLSYKDATLSFGDIVALVGPNASGKSNAVSAMKLLRDIPIHGLPTAIARRGGFDQLRHRSSGRPNNPALRLTFRYPGQRDSYYEIRFAAVAGKRYEVRSESAEILGGPIIGSHSFRNDGKNVRWSFDTDADETIEQTLPIPPGQSAVSTAGSFASYLVGQVLQLIQTVEINPVRVGELQAPSSTREFEPDGSNTSSIFEDLNNSSKSQLLDLLSSIVPGIARIETRKLGDRQTLAFLQDTPSGRREFLAKQMSDGTLRSFGILLSLLQPRRPRLILIEEPEVAIHLGALRTLVDILRQQTEDAQVVMTTHSADIVDSLPVEALRVVWTDGAVSHISPVAEHTLAALRTGLISPGQLLRSDALDPSA